MSRKFSGSSSSLAPVPELRIFSAGMLLQPVHEMSPSSSQRSFSWCAALRISVSGRSTVALASNEADWRVGPMLSMSVSPLAVWRIFERYDRPMRVSSVGCSMKPTFQPGVALQIEVGIAIGEDRAARHGQLHHGLLFVLGVDALPVQAKAHRELVVDLVGHRGVHVDGLDVELVGVVLAGPAFVVLGHQAERRADAQADEPLFIELQRGVEVRHHAEFAGVAAVAAGGTRRRPEPGMPGTPGLRLSPLSENERGLDQVDPARS